MGWWKCSNNIYLTEVALDLSQSQGKYAAGKTIRLFVFIRLLNFSADNVVLASYEHLSNITGQPVTQCQIVWDTCIKHDVLRKDGNGYSAREWMHEQGLLPDREVVVNPIETVQPETPKQKRQYEIKEQVRPNVRLSRKETEELKKDYSDEQIARMLDKLSEYKTNTGRNYQSDYQAIRKWVYKTLDEKPKKIAGHTELVDFPDWIFGINGESNDEG